MTDITHRQAAFAQVSLSMIFSVGYFCVIILMMTGYMEVPSDSRDAFMALLGVLTAGEGTILGYWFSRQRQSAPDSSQPPEDVQT